MVKKAFLHKWKQCFQKKTVCILCWRLENDSKTGVCNVVSYNKNKVNPLNPSTSVSDMPPVMIQVRCKNLGRDFQPDPLVVFA